MKIGNYNLFEVGSIVENFNIFIKKNLHLLSIKIKSKID